MTAVIVGNGAVALMAACELLRRDHQARLKIVAPALRPGCASLAAAAMFNSFCEVEVGTFKSQFERQKWLFNRQAAPRWPSLLAALAEDSGREIYHASGTYLINNHVSDRLEDENFDAVLAALREQGEPHDVIAPADIPRYKPASPARAGRALFIPREGWVNARHLMDALDAVLQASPRVSFVDDRCLKVVAGPNGRIDGVVTAGGATVGGDLFLLAPGATFSEIIAGSRLGLSFPRVFYGVGCTVLLGTGANTLPCCVRTPNRGLACGVYAAPRDAGHTIIGASNLISPVPAPYARLTSVYTLVKAAMEQINSDYYRAEVESLNVGWRPIPEDGVPLIGLTEIPNLLVATGTRRDGLHCSPLIAECLVDLMTRGRTAQDLTLFKPDRKPHRTYKRAEAIDTAVRHIMNAAFQHDFVPAKNRMLEEMERYHRRELEALHDQVGAHEWGIPPEMLDMYRYKHLGNASP
jgi:glycine oxidase